MTKTVVAISSFVMRGAVGLRAAQFALERRGATVWPVPTVLMPWHPGLGPSTRTVPADLPAQLGELGTRAAEVDAVLTGYFANAETVAAAARLIDSVRAARPDAIVLVDPITGDERGRYVPDSVAEAIRNELVPRADIITPNAFELLDLSGGSDAAAARRLGPPAVVVTSAVAEAGQIAAMLVEGDGATLAEHDALPEPPRGTGDLFAAVLLSARLDGAPLREALAEAAAATLAVVRASDGEALALAAAQGLIAHPPAGTVTLRPWEGGEVDAPSMSSLAPMIKGGVPQRVLGIDGAPKGGWAVVSIAIEGPPAPELFRVDDLGPLLRNSPVAVIDMPIGLPDRIEDRGRGPERAIRPLLGPRQSSVFSMPSRAAVFAESYAEACVKALQTSTPPRSISQQAYHIFPKIREVDLLHDQIDGSRLFEGHPELAFWRLNGDRPMSTPKGGAASEGCRERIAVLARHGIPRALFDSRPRGLPLVDAVDAAALALIARRCARGEAQPFPDPPGRDSLGRRIAIWA